MCRLSLALFVLLSGQAAFGDDGPRSLDSRIGISLFAEQPLIATPTGIDVDAQGRVWAIECNTHFRPTDYPGHPSDRILIFHDENGDGRAEAPRMFADGFTATMSVAVRPPWMPPLLAAREGISLENLKTTTQVLVATRNRVVLLEDIDGDEASDRQTTLFELDTKGNYPHNGFAGFAFDPAGNIFVGMGENLGEPYKVLDHTGRVVFESTDGGNIYQFQPDGTGFRPWAEGFWNPHASCFDAFGRMFTVDNDPDSKPPCRLLHVIEGGDYGYRFRNGRKGLHPFTSWDGQIPGTLPMVAGTGEAPSAVVAYEHDAFPEEYLGNLFATSWGDHRIDRFRLKPRGASFKSLPEPLIVGGENFRPVGLALAPDGSLYCTDWVRRDYELHGQGRIWRIAANEQRLQGESSLTTPDGKDVTALKKDVSSPSLPVRRTAARRLATTNANALLSVAVDSKASLRSRYEALTALALHREIPDHLRVIKSMLPADQAPFDPLQTILLTQFDERPSVSRVVDLLKDSHGSDPLYVLAGMDVFAPIFRALASGGSEKIVQAANACVPSGDPFAYLKLIQVIAETLTPEQLCELIGRDAPLSTDLRLCLVLAARKAGPHQEAAVRAALERPEPAVRRAAVQWAAEQRMTSLRSDVQTSLSREPMTADLFLATIAALEMLDGRKPEEFDRTPSAKYVIPLATDPQTPPVVLAAALRIADPRDPAISVDLLTKLAQRPENDIQHEAIVTLAASEDPLAVDALLTLAEHPEHRPDVLLGLARWLHRAPTDRRVRDFFVKKDPWTIDTLRALRGLIPMDADARDALIRRLPTVGENPEPAEMIAQIILALGPEAVPDAIRSRAEPRPTAPADWLPLLSSSPGDSESGRIVFYHPQGPGCSRCHTIEGRGGKVGPDLSRIGQSLSHERLVESILEPSREVAPQFTSWQMVTNDGLVHTGMIVHENEGVTILGDQEGKTVEFKTLEIAERHPQRTSVMPDRLAERMTVQEFRDLLAFLKHVGG